MVLFKKTKDSVSGSRQVRCGWSGTFEKGQKEEPTAEPMAGEQSAEPHADFGDDDESWGNWTGRGQGGELAASPKFRELLLAPRSWSWVM